MSNIAYIQYHEPSVSTDTGSEILIMVRAFNLLSDIKQFTKSTKVVK